MIHHVKAGLFIVDYIPDSMCRYFFSNPGLSAVALNINQVMADIQCPRLT